MQASINPRAALLYVPFFLSGLAVLALETLWVRGLHLLIGGTSQALSCVVTAFLIGHAAGASVAARHTPKTPQLSMRAYAWLELAAAALGFAAVLLCFTQGAQLRTAVALIPGPTVLGQFLVALILVGPASAAFGATLPLLATAAMGRVRLPALYSVNLLGAAVGPLLATFWGVAKLGAVRTASIAACLSVTAACIAWLGARKFPTEPPRRPEVALGRPVAAATPSPRLALAVAAASGFLVLSAQVAWVRIFGLLVGDRVFVTALALSSILLGLALGGALANKAMKRYPAVSVATSCLLLAALSFAAALSLSDAALFSLLRDSPNHAPHALLVRLPFLICAVIAPATFMGTLFPISLALIEQTGEVRHVGLAVALNTGAGAAGGLLTAYVLSVLLGTRGIMVMHAAIAASLAIAMSRFTPGHRRIVVGAAIAAFAISVWKRGPALGVVHPELRAMVTEDASGVFEVAELPGGRTAIFNTGSRLAGELGSGRTADTHRLLAIVAAYFAPRLDHVAVLGVGYGITAGALAGKLRAGRVDGVDILPAVFDELPRFARENHHAHQAQALHLLPMDGRVYLHEQQRSLDALVVSVHQHRTQGASLATREFYEQAAGTLAGDAVLVQYLWGDDANVVLASATAVFGYSEAFALKAGEAIVVLSREPLGPRGAQRAGLTELLAQTAVASVEEFQERMQKGRTQMKRWRGVALDALHTDARPVLEFRRSADIGTFRISLSPAPTD